MRTTVTVRTDDDLRNQLERRAAELGKSVSEVVRDILRDALTPRSMADRVGHLQGRLELPPDREPWRQALRERNWRQ